MWWSLGRTALVAAGQTPQFSGVCFKQKRIITTYSAVPTSGIARRDPPRHVDVIIQIRIKIHREKSLIPNIFNYFHHLQNSSGLGNSTPWSASSRGCGHTNSQQIPAYVALFREKSMICLKILHFRRSTEELRPRERSHEFRAGRLV